MPSAPAWRSDPKEDDEMKQYTQPLMEVLELTADTLCFEIESEPTMEDNGEDFENNGL